MRKSDKKIDNQLRLVLTEICEDFLKEIQGFQWVTHVVNYSNFPGSLKIFCVFDTNVNRDIFLQKAISSKLELLMLTKLKGIDIKVKSINSHLLYDTEESCSKQHNGNWANRLG